MVLAILSVLIAADLFLIFAYLRLQRRQSAHHEIVRELTEERSMLLELRAQIREELMATQNQVKGMKEQMQVLATEAEQEVRHGLADITHEVESIIGNISQKLDAPMEALNEKQRFIVQLAKDAKKEREVLARLVTRSENVARLLKAGGSWEDVVDEIQARRFEDIRAMLARGLGADKIAVELGVTEQEVRLVSGTI
jgi:conjugal transfer/entry exclusion protein